MGRSDDKKDPAASSDDVGGGRSSLRHRPADGVINLAVGHPSILPHEVMANAMQRAAAKLTLVATHDAPGSSSAVAGAVPLNYVSSRGTDETLATLASFLTDAYGAQQGDASPTVRVSSSSRSSSSSAWDVSPDSLAVTCGVSHGIDMACAALTKPGDVVVVELPTYFLAADIFVDHGLRIHGIPGASTEQPDADDHEDGAGGPCFDVDALERQIIAGLRPRLVYLVPTHSNPRGCTLGTRARRKLVRLAHDHGFFIVADEVYHLLHWGATPPPPRMTQVERDLVSERARDEEKRKKKKGRKRGPSGRGGEDESRVVSVSSFTKILAPGLRVGWIEAAPPLVDAVAGRGYVVSGGCVAPFAAGVAAEVISGGDQAAHLARLTEAYGRTSAAMAREVAHHAPRVGWRAPVAAPAGGYFMWLGLPPGVTTRSLAPAAAEAGVAFLPGERCVPDQLDRELSAAFGEKNQDRRGGALGSGRTCGEFVRLCFAFLSEEEIVEGVARLADAVESVAAAAGGAR